MKEMLKIIDDAIKESMLQGIKSNSIILNEKYDICRDFYLSVAPTLYSKGCYTHVAPMLLGKQVVMLDLPKDYVFAIADLNLKRNMETVWEENQLLKKYLKLVGDGENQCLVIKGVSNKKKKEDFNKIKEILGYGTEI